MNPTLLVMAAGMGSRYGSLKQVAAVGPGSETLLEYSIYDAIRAGFGRVVIVIRRGIEAVFKTAITGRIGNRIAVAYVYQELNRIPGPYHVPTNRKKPWGTAQAILVAEEVITEPFAAINADNFYGAHSFELLADHLKGVQDPHAADYAMLGYALQDTLSDFGGVSRAVCRCDAEGFLQRLVELARITRAGDRAQYTDEAGRAHPLSGNEIVSRNMWGFTPSIFSHLRREFVSFLDAQGRDDTSEFLIPNVVGTLVANRLATVKVLPSRDRGFGVTYREDIPDVIKRIEALIARGIYPEKLWG